MTAIPNPMRSFRATVGIGWLLLATAAVIYARLKAIPTAIALPLALAFLVEYPFYLLPGFAAARERFTAKGKPRAAALLAASAVAPWLIYALSTGHFNLPALALLSAIALVMCFWYVVFPAYPAADLIYLSLFAAIMLLKVFPRIYPPVYPPGSPKLDVSILGHVMLIRVMAFSFVAIRGNAGADYRFIPAKREWIAGLRWFALLLPVTGAAYWALGLVVLRPHPLNIALVAGIFLGILWVTATFEEFIFRGPGSPGLKSGLPARSQR